MGLGLGRSTEHLNVWSVTTKAEKVHFSSFWLAEYLALFKKEIAYCVCEDS
jgi:hypothetical protein